MEYIPFGGLGYLNTSLNSYLKAFILNPDNSVILYYMNNNSITTSYGFYDGTYYITCSSSTILCIKVLGNKFILGSSTDTYYAPGTNKFTINIDKVYYNSNYLTSKSLITQCKLTIVKVKINLGNAFIALYSDYTDPQIYVVSGVYDYNNNLLTMYTGELRLPVYLESVQVRVGCHGNAEPIPTTWPTLLPSRQIVTDWGGLNGSPDTWVDDHTQVEIPIEPTRVFSPNNSFKYFNAPNDNRVVNYWIEPTSTSLFPGANMRFNGTDILACSTSYNPTTNQVIFTFSPQLQVTVDTGYTFYSITTGQPTQITNGAAFGAYPNLKFTLGGQSIKLDATFFTLMGISWTGGMSSDSLGYFHTMSGAIVNIGTAIMTFDPGANTLVPNSGVIGSVIGGLDMIRYRWIFCFQKKL